jgi:ABC-2 type transport system ATP-binding protein
MLCTLTALTEGTATVAGCDVGTRPGDVRLRIGVALQDAALDPKQTGRELLRLQGLLYGLPKQAMAQRVEELGELIDLTDALDRPIGTYSGGMRRRLDLAAALVHNPEVLFLDEPTTGLDPQSRITVWNEVRRLNEQLGMTIFLTTQYLEEVDELADRVAVLDRGGVVAEGAPSELKRRVPGGHARLYFRDLDALDAAAPLFRESSRDDEALVLQVPTDDTPRSLRALLDRVDQLAVEVDRVTVETPNLDDVFLALTGDRELKEAA